MTAFASRILPLLLLGCIQILSADETAVPPPLQATGIQQINPAAVEILLSGERRMTLDFYGDTLFRWFRDDRGGMLRDPEADPPARILVDQPRQSVSPLTLEADTELLSVSTPQIRVEVDRETACLRVIRLSDGEVVLAEQQPARFGRQGVTLQLDEQPDEYFFGGGVQNGRFSHKGKIIQIENQNSWTDGGVASPNPFYWSTRGAGLLWHTFAPGTYNFGASEPGTTTLSHRTDYLDVFVITGKTPTALMQGYFQLTGAPVLLPKFGFYLGHLNAYNRDYWLEVDEGGILFEDGKRYKESQKDNGGIRETLNGERDNMQFSARAVVDRYATHDMPLGWVLPNDGYEAGYGQADSLEGNVENLRVFGDYARERGVEIGLWTQSDLHPDPEVEPLLQRDIVREVRDAGVRALKTDVAWVGPGYSFGLNGIADAAKWMTYYGNNSRPFIITLNGWAGTQRYGGVWTGDQTGGKWEYIRFHIPTYIGAGLSGMSNISSDMDGIFGGSNPVVHTRDYQWKTFTSMQLNMDGWGADPKYPHTLGEPGTSINRWYLKLKSELMPYTYSVARQAVDGLPLVRAMFLHDPNPFTYSEATRYQFFYGPFLLVAPIYQDTRADENGNDERDNLYLPEGKWIDYFTGEVLTGGRVINHLSAPLWKTPVFVRPGAILPKTRPHNQPSEAPRDHRIFECYPHGESSFTLYDDDGKTEQYLEGHGAITPVHMNERDGRVQIVIEPTQGNFDGFEPIQSTELQINTTARPEAVRVLANGRELKKAEAVELEYEPAPNLNRFATPGTPFADEVITKNPLLHIRLGKLDITQTRITVEIEGYEYEMPDTLLVSTGPLQSPQPRILEEDITPYSLQPRWSPVANADYYEIAFEGMVYSTLRRPTFRFDGLQVETDYTFQLRAVNQSGASDWVTLHGRTKSDPYEFALKGLVARSTATDQPGSGLDNLFDFDPRTTWHTTWGQEAVPFSFVVDLQSVNVLERLEYLPRDDASNGTLLKGRILHSMNGHDWTEAGRFDWERNNETKTFPFAETPTAGYLKIEVEEGVKAFGSGQQLYVFKVPGSPSYIPGDINDDGVLDLNDLTSYTNYTGLRQGDADFDGYIRKGDTNNNGLIDAFDISQVTTRIEGGVSIQPDEPELQGQLEASVSETELQAGDTLEITVTGKDLAGVNALSFALPYNPQDLRFDALEATGMAEMEDLSKDRRHSNGGQAFYATFVNLGNQPTLEGNDVRMVIRFTVQRTHRFTLDIRDAVLVSKDLKTLQPLP